MADGLTKQAIFLLMIIASIGISFYIWQKSSTISPDIIFKFSDSQLLGNTSVSPPVTRPTITMKPNLPIQVIGTTSSQESILQHDELSHKIDQLTKKFQAESSQWFDKFKLVNGPESNNRVTTLGSPPNGSGPMPKFAVFSTTTSNRAALEYAFYLPLTVLAWQRIGFRSIVIIVGDIDQWFSDELLHHVLQSALTLDAFIIMLETKMERSVMVSQVSRLFASSILQKLFPTWPESYLLTTDSDLWPLDPNQYLLPQNKSILSVNNECCGEFKHRERTYTMRPIGFIGMNSSMWMQVMTRNSLSPSSSEDIVTYMLREFGSVATSDITKGDNVGWYLDQRLLSVAVGDWISMHNAEDSIQNRPTVRRIDRSNWRPKEIGSKTDAHLLTPGYLPGQWVRTRDLLILMYGTNSTALQWCDSYYEQFAKLFLSSARRSS